MSITLAIADCETNRSFDLRATTLRNSASRLARLAERSVMLQAHQWMVDLGPHTTVYYTTHAMHQRCSDVQPCSPLGKQAPQPNTYTLGGPNGRIYSLKRIMENHTRIQSLKRIMNNNHTRIQSLKRIAKHHKRTSFCFVSKSRFANDQSLLRRSIRRPLTAQSLLRRLAVVITEALLLEPPASEFWLPTTQASKWRASAPGTAKLHLARFACWLACWLASWALHGRHCTLHGRRIAC
jgi:hypothetical protein